MNRFIITALLSAAIALPAIAQTTLLEVREWTLGRLFDEVGTFARWDIMDPVVQLHGVESTEFHACLMVANQYPDTRRAPVWRIVDDCIEYAKEAR